MAVIVDYSQCTGCRNCIENCIGGVLDLVDGRVTVVNPEECTECLTCELGCPHEAIKVESED